MTNLASIKSPVGFIGAGNMATALMRGMLKQNFPASEIYATDLDSKKTQALQESLGIHAVAEAGELIKSCPIVFLATKPHGIVPLLKEHAKLATSDSTLWLSIAAGVTTTTIEEALESGARVIRIMPNTPALVGEGASGVSAGINASPGDVALARQLMGAVGICELINESMMDALTGVSGSGPAYVFLAIEAMADGGVRAGLPRPTALRLAAQTMKGAAALVLETGKHPGELKDMVTSPGGTTIAGVAALEAAGFRNALISAVTAAAGRSKELSKK